MKTGRGFKYAAASCLALLVAVLFCGCSPRQDGEPSMFPDYRNVTVPEAIAPLNFHYEGRGAEDAVTVFSAGNLRVSVKGDEVCLKPARWRELTRAATGSAICVESSLLGKWNIHVSGEPIDNYLTYRLIEPGYEVWDRVEIMERNITTFDERVISSFRNTDNACMNCHIHKGELSMFYLRGTKGGAVFSDGRNVRKLALKTEGMISGTVYGDLHPSGRFGVFSTNIIIPGFHTAGGRRLEVYDAKSDLCVVDFAENRIIVPPAFSDAGKLETFPCFSADGKSVYYCSADTVSLLGEIEKLKYSLMKCRFNPETGEMGPGAEVIWDGPARNASVCHPKASPDGEWLVFTVADYGTFPIWHRECDLWIMNLSDGESRPLAEINSEEYSDTYHSWSSNGKWMVFASKRGDGQFGRPYICHVGADGTFGKPFLLPQKNSHHYETCLKSYNIPDLGMSPVIYDAEGVGLLWNATESEQFVKSDAIGMSDSL